MAEGSRFAKSLRSPWQWGAVGLILLVIGAIVFWPFTGGIESVVSNPTEDKVRFINLLLFSYANDHGGKYPSGASSTEVFQKLIDENYVGDDVSVFYCEMPGKTKPTSNKLKPENVSWDITVPISDGDSNDIPIAFLTGYRIQYAPGGCAVPLRTSGLKYPGLYVAYKSYMACFLKDDGLPDHIVKNVISPNFDPKGKTFQQLTPDGPLAP